MLYIIKRRQMALKKGGEHEEKRKMHEYMLVLSDTVFFWNAYIQWVT